MNTIIKHIADALYAVAPDLQGNRVRSDDVFDAAEPRNRIGFPNVIKILKRLVSVFQQLSTHFSTIGRTSKVVFTLLPSNIPIAVAVLCGYGRPRNV